MPHPAVLEGYERVVPGAARRILDMAEADARHQHMLETSALQAMGRETLLGQLFALVVTLSAFATVAYLGHLGHPTAASVVGGTTIVGLVSAFVAGRKVRSGDESRR